MTTEQERTADDRSSDFSEALHDHRAMLAQKIRSSLNGAKAVLFDGEALSRDEVDDRFRQMERRHRMLLLEVVALLAALAGAGFVLWRLLVGLSG